MYYRQPLDVHENDIALVIEPIIDHRSVVPTTQSEMVATIDTSNGVVSIFAICSGQGVEIIRTNKKPTRW